MTWEAHHLQAGAQWEASRHSPLSSWLFCSSAKVPCLSSAPGVPVASSHPCSRALLHQEQHTCTQPSSSEVGRDPNPPPPQPSPPFSTMLQLGPTARVAQVPPSPRLAATSLTASPAQPMAPLCPTQRLPPTPFFHPYLYIVSASTSPNQTLRCAWKCSPCTSSMATSPPPVSCGGSALRHRLLCPVPPPHAEPHGTGQQPRRTPHAKRN